MVARDSQWRGRPLAAYCSHALQRTLLAIMVLLPASMPPANALDPACKDPLFETHWFGKMEYATSEEAFKLATLNSIPIVKSGMKYCPQFNDKGSCCSAEFDPEQRKYFDYFRNMIFPSKLVRIAAHRASVSDVKNQVAYQGSSRVEKEQHSLALVRFNAVLHPDVHSDCFSALLTYAAGMNCFACREDWFQFVRLHGGQVQRVNVDAGVCMELWSRCEVFGEAAIALKQAILDSALAKQAKAPVENLDMFSDQQALCDWLHDSVALHPFRRPTEQEREAVPSTVGQSSTKKAQSTAMAAAEAAEVKNRGIQAPQNAQGRRLQEEEDVPAAFIDVLREGHLSGFDTSWSWSGPLGSSSRASKVAFPFAASLVPCVLAALVMLNTNW